MKIENLNYVFELDQTCRQSKPEIRDIETIEGVTKLECQLTYRIIKDDTIGESWRFSVKFLNYKDFRNLNVIAVCNVHMKCEINGDPDQCSDSNSGEIELKNMKNETAWTFEDYCSEYPLLTTDLRVTLIVQDTVWDISDFQKDFGNLFESGLYSDLILVSEDVEFKIHKIVLCSRSPVFQEMLDEKSDGKVEVKDVRFAVLEELLKYMYTGSFVDSGEPCFLEDLYTAAEKYDVSDLKKDVSKRLCETLSVENVVERLFLAEQCDGVMLRNRCFEFIRDNCNSLKRV